MGYTLRLEIICARVRAMHLRMRSGQWQTITWNAFALDGFSNDGGGLMAWLAQSLAKLLHTVSVHNDGMPAIHTYTNIKATH